MKNSTYENYFKEGLDMTKPFFKRLLTCIAAAFLCIGLLGSADTVEAADYYVYTDGNGTQYYVSSTKTDWRFRTNIHNAYITAVYTNQHQRATYYSYSWDEGDVYYSAYKSDPRSVSTNPVAQAVLNFCEAHWGRYGFHE